MMKPDAVSIENKLKLIQLRPHLPQSGGGEDDIYVFNQKIKCVYENFF